MLRYLMHKDNIVALVDSTDFYIKQIEVFDRYLMPIMVSEDKNKTSTLFLNWLNSRPKPCNVQLFKNPILSKIGNTYEDISKIICASIIDCYWMKPIELQSLIWKDINYFDNDIINKEKVLIDMTDDFYKYEDYREKINELVNLKHGYKKNIKYYTKNKDNEYCVVKSLDITDNGFSVFFELISNVFADFLDFDNVSKYYISPLTISDNKTKFKIPVSVTTLPINNDKIELITAYDMINMGIFNEMDFLEYIINNGLKDSLDNMLILDFLLMNPNRTFKDIAFLRNSENLEIIGLAPLFNFNSQIKNKECEILLKTNYQQISLIEKDKYINFNALYEALKYVEIIISYSAFSLNEQKEILNLIKKRISELSNIINNISDKNSLDKYIIAKNIEKRFDIDKIYTLIGKDPIVEQSINNLYINTLSNIGKIEFDEFEKNNKNIKERFDNFKKNTLLIN